MNWNGKRVLVTGAGGFIGSHVVEQLVGLGAEVTGFIRYKASGDLGTINYLPEPVRSAVKVVSGDLADPATAASLVRGQEVVLHLAALVGIPYSYVHPVEVLRTNTLATGFLLEACRQQGIERMVCLSTSEVYGTALYAPIDEEHPLQAQSPYAASKIGSDQLGLSYYLSFNLPVAIARPFNTYGPRQSSRAVIPTIISQALHPGPIRLGSTTPTRDLCYAGDTATGIITLAASKEAVGEVINLGTGSEISIGDLAERICALIGRPLEIETDQQRVRPGASEVMRLIANRDKAARLIGWEPRISIDEGLGRTIAWIRENPDFFKVRDYHI
jgi:NAD dependent epimerase/dehydratase